MSTNNKQEKKSECCEECVDILNLTEKVPFCCNPACPCHSKEEKSECKCGCHADLCSHLDCVYCGRVGDKTCGKPFVSKDDELPDCGHNAIESNMCEPYCRVCTPQVENTEWEKEFEQKFPPEEDFTDICIDRKEIIDFISKIQQDDRLRIKKIIQGHKVQFIHNRADVVFTEEVVVNLINAQVEDIINNINNSPNV